MVTCSFLGTGVCDFVMLVTLTKMPLGRHYIAMFEATQNVMLKPTESWREALLDHRVMDLFFTVSTLLVYQFGADVRCPYNQIQSYCCMMFSLPAHFLSLQLPCDVCDGVLSALTSQALSCCLCLSIYWHIHPTIQFIHPFINAWKLTITITLLTQLQTKKGV